MTKIDITAADQNKPASPNEPTPQQTQQPGDNQRQQQGGVSDKDKPAQQK